MKKIMSALEFYEDSDYSLAEFDEGGFLGINETSLSKLLIEFAKMHVHAALDAAYQNGMLKVISNEEYREDEDLVEEYECGCDTIVLHKASILNAYPDELIK